MARSNSLTGSKPALSCFTVKLKKYTGNLLTFSDKFSSNTVCVDGAFPTSAGLPFAETWPAALLYHSDTLVKRDQAA